MSKNNEGKRINAIKARAKIAKKTAAIMGSNAGVAFQLWRGDVGRKIGSAIKTLMPEDARAKVADLRLVKEAANEEISTLEAKHAASAVKAREVAQEISAAFMCFMRGEGAQAVNGIEINSVKACQEAISATFAKMEAEVKTAKAAKEKSTKEGEVIASKHAQEISAKVAALVK